MSIFIKGLPLDKLLYRLWINARMSHYFYYCPDCRPILTLAQVKSDINNMLANGPEIDVAVYQGKLLYVRIDEDYLDPNEYDSYNGRGSAGKIINIMKKEELEKVSLCYFKFS